MIEVRAVSKDSSTTNSPTISDFFFYTDIGKYTGIYASSLKDFEKKLAAISLESIEFHHQRGDFQRWVREVFRDRVLADRIDRIEAGARGEVLRAKLIEAVTRRVDQLRILVL